MLYFIISLLSYLGSATFVTSVRISLDYGNINAEYSVSEHVKSLIKSADIDKFATIIHFGITTIDKSCQTPTILSTTLQLPAGFDARKIYYLVYEKNFCPSYTLNMNIFEFFEWTVQAVRIKYLYSNDCHPLNFSLASVSVRHQYRAIN